MGDLPTDFCFRVKAQAVVTLGACPGHLTMPTEPTSSTEAAMRTCPGGLGESWGKVSTWKLRLRAAHGGHQIRSR